mmetsp:Transcript_26469/g.43335  ORF Transcript_26469/g.43335 Transcript_26469/m.43335 type:complete len:1527 (+) Transcript_26469:112-4692(+)|eukprot:CAMPEP_0184355530 /NCGR_PEP_ID=MMETSP1089-20130417/96655_1 /TAXON_ID=38269 ORGANISM="Gloeochaete wittrockiana, Strain SAG46.84" /NCGR_SAMPLE_ID=MMETSP1089 /ASSEMBLY_ACC=CAM_ASM_000445 /LENGTH=1526 /DNA_ID=CAMNT_0026692259 /DNA_START=50 /DNA_END=4630 /DNA_ORIENTATION=-
MGKTKDLRNGPIAKVPIEIERLPKRLAAEESSSGIISKLNARRKERHEQAVRTFNDGFVKSCAQLEEIVVKQHQLFKYKLEDNHKVIVALFGELNDERLKAVDVLEAVENVWSQIDANIGLREQWIQAFGMDLESMESERGKNLENRLQDLGTELTDIAFMLPSPIKQVIEEKMIMVNQSMAANRLKYAELVGKERSANTERALANRRQWEERVRAWRQISHDQSITRFKEALQGPTYLDPQGRRSLLESLKQEQSKLSDRRMDQLHALSTLTGPSLTFATVSEWNVALQKVLDDTDAIYIEYLQDIRKSEKHTHGESTNYCQRLKEALLRYAAVRPEEVEKIISDECIPIVDSRSRAANELINSIEVSLLAQSALYRSVWTRLSSFVLDLAHCSDTNESESKALEETLIQQVARLRDADTKDHARQEEQFASLMEKMKDAKDQGEAKNMLDEAIRYLNAIEQGYRSFHEKVMQLSGKHAANTQEHSLAYQQLVCKQFGLWHPSSSDPMPVPILAHDQPPPSMQLLPSQDTSEKEKRPTSASELATADNVRSSSPGLGGKGRPASRDKKKQVPEKKEPLKGKSFKKKEAAPEPPPDPAPAPALVVEEGRPPTPPPPRTDIEDTNQVTSVKGVKYAILRAVVVVLFPDGTPSPPPASPLDFASRVCIQTEAVPLEKIASIFVSFRRSSVNDLIESRSDVQLLRARQCAKSIQEHVTNELDDMLRAHMPRHGRAELDNYHKRSNELASLKTRFDRHLQAYATRSTAHRNSYNELLRQFETRLEQHSIRQKLNTVALGNAANTDSLARIGRSAKLECTKFMDDLTEQLKAAVTSTRNAIQDLNKMNLAYREAMQSLTAGETYIERLGKFDAESESSLKMREASFEELGTKHRKESERIIEEFDIQYSYHLEDMQLIQRLEEKERGARSKLRIEFTDSDMKDATFEKHVGELEALWSAPSTLKRILEVPEEEESMSFKVMSLVHMLRAEAHERSSYFECLQSSITLVPVAVKEGAPAAATPSEAAPLAQTASGKGATGKDKDNRPPSSAGQNATSAPAKGAKAPSTPNKGTKPPANAGATQQNIALVRDVPTAPAGTLMYMVQSVQAGWKQELLSICQDYHKNRKERQVTRPARIPPTFEEHVLKVENTVRALNESAANFRSTRIKGLRGLIARLGLCLQQVPSVVFGDILATYEGQVERERRIMDTQYGKSKEKLEAKRSEHQVALHPRLANPNFSKELEDICSAEDKRGAELLAISKLYLQTLTEKETALAADFLRRIVHSQSVLNVLFDTTVMSEDLIKTEETVTVAERKTLRRLLSDAQRGVENNDAVRASVSTPQMTSISSVALAAKSTKQSIGVVKKAKKENEASESNRPFKTTSWPLLPKDELSAEKALLPTIPALAPSSSPPPSAQGPGRPLSRSGTPERPSSRSKPLATSSSPVPPRPSSQGHNRPAGDKDAVSVPSFMALDFPPTRALILSRNRAYESCKARYYTQVKEGIRAEQKFANEQTKWEAQWKCMLECLRLSGS